MTRFYLCSDLSEVPFVRLIVSLDHVKAEEFFGKQLMRKLRFACFALSTFENFRLEMHHQCRLDRPYFKFVEKASKELEPFTQFMAMTKPLRAIVALIA